MVKVMQRKKIQLILARLLFRSDGDIKSFTSKQKLRQLLPPEQLYKKC